MKFVQWHLGIVWVALALMLTVSALALAGGDDSDPNSPDPKDPGREEVRRGTDPGLRGPDDFGPPNRNKNLFDRKRLLGPDETGPRSHED